MVTEFKTKRLYLRYANQHDAAILLTLVNQVNFKKYIGDKAIYTLSDANNYIEQSFKATQTPRVWPLYYYVTLW